MASKAPIPQTEREKRWYELVVDGMHPTDAAMKVYNCSTRESAQVMGSRLKKKFKHALEKDIQEKVKTIAPQALGVIIQLALSAENESVRLKAARDLLDRSGFAPIVQKQEVEYKDKTEQELIGQLKSLLGDRADAVLQILEKESVSIN